MSLIYEPRGKAREYSPLALNHYTGGCSHRCTYCYCSGMSKAFGQKWEGLEVPRALPGLDRQAAGASRQILLSFKGDPYCHAEPTCRHTRHVLGILAAARCSVAILTKGGTRCLDDLDMFARWPDARVKVGATLTFLDAGKSREHEPGAADPADRLDALRALSSRGVHTWASIEPVIDPRESLAVIEASLPHVDAYKVGKLNHRANTTDWRAFVVAAAEMIRSGGRTLYVKDDLRPFAPSGFLRPEECNPETVYLQDRPEITLTPLVVGQRQPEFQA